MIDRFGLLPQASKNLFQVASIKLQSLKLGIKKLEASAQSGRIEFASVTQVNPLTIVKLVQNQPQKYRLEGANHLKFSLDMENAEQRIKKVSDLLNQFAQTA